MHTRKLIVALLISFAAALAVPCAAAQDKTQSAAAEDSAAMAMLKKASALTDIRSASSPAFMLIANLHFAFGKEKVDGKYGLEWAAPNVFHEEYVMPGFDQKTVVANGWKYQKRTSNFLPLPVGEWETLLSGLSTGPLPKGMDLSLIEPPKEWKGQANLSCVSAQIKNMGVAIAKQTACFDKSTGLPAGTDLDSNGQKISVRFSNYLRLGSESFPGKIEYTHNGGLRMEADVTSLKPVQAFAGTEFAPIAGVAPEAWCEKPTLDYSNLHQRQGDGQDGGGSDILREMQSFAARAGEITVPTFLYVHINAKGQPDDVGVLKTSNAEEANRFVNALHGMNLPFAACNGTAIPQEFVLDLWPR
jgi:hypothetical protein